MLACDSVHLNKNLAPNKLFTYIYFKWFITMCITGSADKHIICFDDSIIDVHMQCVSFLLTISFMLIKINK